eukprot:CAMPEP_0194329248 /NCGR_PEP_ID=MMETSP0171-20130528/47628_1 /TAXON_ID=218684 /ORGANISM="Corethron pennatum, Strain L29A3" /LENGTH=112 /DNA_ID=CAMNT_0039089923 /DNA_START=63 /DNA_END=398 /DNA_ORIENTATION=-
MRPQANFTVSFAAPTIAPCGNKEDPSRLKPRSTEPSSPPGSARAHVVAAERAGAMKAGGGNVPASARDEATTAAAQVENASLLRCRKPRAIPRRARAFCVLIYFMCAVVRHC